MFFSTTKRFSIDQKSLLELLRDLHGTKNIDFENNTFLKNLHICKYINISSCKNENAIFQFRMRKYSSLIEKWKYTITFVSLIHVLNISKGQ